MLSMTFLALSDSKTITVPRAWEPGGTGIFPEISALEAIGIIALFFGALYLLTLVWPIGRGKADRRSTRRPDATSPGKTRKAPRAARPPKAKAPAPATGKPAAISPMTSLSRPLILIDGSNVMHWQDNTPSLLPLLQTIDELRQRGFTPSVVFDANAGYKLMGKYMHHDDLARLLTLPHDQVLVVPKGMPADPYLLTTARDLGASIVSNDRYRDWAEEYPEFSEPQRLIKGGVKDGKVHLLRTDKARRANAVNPA